ncbi:nuclear transport factor 2 family protein [Pontimicrobium sp. SW4]|uniref:Nuclear transport factor 2 family protein n=1 Tax=Pontimicrobium sp. SW4 TaxID=3153519 RepID=A0AAU7BPD6_9FLAO
MKSLKLKFIVILLFITTSFISKGQNNHNEKYYRHLKYNHVSPHIPIMGIYEINKVVASKTSHYVFKFNKSNQLVEIINNHYHTEKRHPLASIGAYKTVINYTEGLETRLFFDKNNRRITNDRDVYKEVYLIDKEGFKYELKFYDLENKPMESSWKVSKYSWSKKGKMIVEKRFNLDEKLVDLSPYFEFEITGILYDKNNLPKEHYNLNDKFEIQENSKGIASYQDTYDTKGNHIKYSYHNANNQLVKNQWGFAYRIKKYDNNGNNLSLLSYDENDSLINVRDIYSNAIVKIASKASQKDSLEIKQKSLEYLTALQELNPKLIEKALHKELAKETIGINPRNRRDTIRKTSYNQMLQFADSWNKAGNKFPPNPNNQVIILDIYDRIATAKLVSDNWVEYLHLIKTNKEWKIINLLWQYKDVGFYSN